MLTKRYLELMDKANQASDRQTYFFYIRQAEQLLKEESPEEYGIQPVTSFVSPSSFANAAWLIWTPQPRWSDLVSWEELVDLRPHQYRNERFFDSLKLISFGNGRIAPNSLLDSCQEKDFSMPPDLSSIKWEDDGEMSAQDTWKLVWKLTKIEDQQRASNLLHLSSKHRHSKLKKKPS